MLTTAPDKTADALLAEAGLLGAHEARPLAGANNRLTRLDGDGWTAVLKYYFRDPSDPRDRFAAEWGFARFLWDAGLRDVPEPLAGDAEAGAALYGFVDGTPVEKAGANEVAAAMDFVTRLNAAKDAGRHLSTASEACFSIAAHLDLVAGRIARLAEAGGEAGDFARGILRETWESVHARIDPDTAELSPAARVLSPSDFGFHNALRRPDGSLAFLDFEYAGWDDPAKLVCDLFCQPEVPVAMDHWDAVAGTVARLTDGEAAARARMDKLFPVYRLKWCCILLAPALPGAAARRDFAGAPAPDMAGRLAQAERLAALAGEGA